jgi:hypothetical protein
MRQQHESQGPERARVGQRSTREGRDGEGAKTCGRKVRRREPGPWCGESKQRTATEKSVKPDQAADHEYPRRGERHFFNQQPLPAERATEQQESDKDC